MQRVNLHLDLSTINIKNYRLYYARIPGVNYNPEYFEERKTKARWVFEKQKSIYNPYFKTNILLTSEGFHHLRFSSNRERHKTEQILKFSLLPLALEVIKRSGTIQEYRNIFTPIGEKGRDGFTKMKRVEYWGLIAIVGENNIKIKTILRRVGEGNIIFWSVMPYSKLRSQKLAHESIENE